MFAFVLFASLTFLYYVSIYTSFTIYYYIFELTEKGEFEISRDSRDIFHSAEEGRSTNTQFEGENGLWLLMSRKFHLKSNLK